MKRVYIIRGQSGEYEDADDRIVRAYEDEGDANVFLSLCSKEHERQMERGRKFLDIVGIDDDISLWSKQHDKWMKRKNKFDPDWEPIDHGVGYYIQKLKVWEDMS